MVGCSNTGTDRKPSRPDELMTTGGDRGDVHETRGYFTVAAVGRTLTDSPVATPANREVHRTL